MGTGVCAVCLYHVYLKILSLTVVSSSVSKLAMYVYILDLLLPHICVSSTTFILKLNVYGYSRNIWDGL